MALNLFLKTATPVEHNKAKRNKTRPARIGGALPGRGPPGAFNRPTLSHHSLALSCQPLLWAVRAFAGTRGLLCSGESRFLVFARLLSLGVSKLPCVLPALTDPGVVVDFSVRSGFSLSLRWSDDF